VIFDQFNISSGPALGVHLVLHSQFAPELYLAGATKRLIGRSSGAIAKICPTGLASHRRSASPRRRVTTMLLVVSQAMLAGESSQGAKTRVNGRCAKVAVRGVRQVT